MRSKPFLKTLLIISIIIPALLLSFNCLFPSETFAISIEDEKKMGEEFVTRIRHQFTLLDDDFANRYFTALGRHLIKPIETRYFPFRFYIIKDKTVNAFAAPGGHIFFYSGLIEVMDSVDNLAAVLAHEIGHESSRHLAKRIEKSKKIGLATMAGILAGVLLGGEAAEALATGSMAAGMQAQLNYSRTDEWQADHLSFEYMKPAGFNPEGMIHALKTIEEQNIRGSDSIPTYLLTHPTGPERMSNLDTMLSNYTYENSNTEVSRFRAFFPFFKAVIRAKCLEPSVAEKRFNRDLKNTPDASPLHFGLGMVYLRSSEYERAISHLKKALEKTPDFLPILTTLGEAYQVTGNDKEAISVLEKALEQDEENRTAQYLLGLSYENMEQYEKVIPLFERIASYKPVKNEIYYHLGIAYGRLERLALAHYNFGLYFKALKQIKKTRFHLKKAQELAANNPSLQKKIRELQEELRKYRKKVSGQGPG